MSRIVRLFAKTADVVDSIRKGGKRKVNNDDEKCIVAFTKKMRFTSPRNSKFNLDLHNVSLRTIDRILIVVLSAYLA